jgi:uncharacterized repeat protein (TIGR03803 family)
LLHLERLETRITPSYSLSTLASFNGANGAAPFAGLVLDSSGNLYGTTSQGGAANAGTVFELAHGSATPTTLASLNGTTGDHPVAGLIADNSGDLDGTAESAGPGGGGTVFELAQGSGTPTTLGWFGKSGGVYSGAPGEYPNSGVVRDSSGNLYGTTGGLGFGFPMPTVFELAHGSSTVTALAEVGYYYNGGFNGEAPNGVILDSSGNLYGTAQAGFGGEGAVFELAQGSSTITPLATFNGSNGAYPHAGLILDSGGNLYGTTETGGASGDGTVFELAPGSGTITTLASFNGTNGADPQAALLMDSSGNLYGTTAQGGAAGDGTAFQLAQGSGTITTLASFNGTNGADPVAGLIMDSNGNLYGTTKQGGAANDGTVFELVPGIGLSPAALPAATVGAGYGQTLTASGGTGPYTFAVTAGSLPAGLSLSSAGVLSGTPTAAGSSAFTATATDSTGTAGSQFYTLAAYPASFRVSGFPSSTTAGVAGSVTVTALDASSNVVPSYQGTVHFSGSDPQAVLPANYTFTTADQGVHTFTATLKTAGSQSIAAWDTANSSTAGSDTGISVTPAATAALVFINVPSSTTAGSAFTLTMTAEDAYGNTTPGYTGTIHFTSSDPRAVLPANYTFTTADAGQHTFSVTLKTAGTQSVTAADTVTGSITGTATGIAVTPAAASQFLLSAPSGVTHGAAFSVTLTVKDAYGNVVTGYTGTVHFSSSDGTASLPANYTFTAADAGVHTFTGLVLRKKGKQTLTVNDAQNSALTATDTINVS